MLQYQPYYAMESGRASVGSTHAPLTTKAIWTLPMAKVYIPYAGPLVTRRDAEVSGHTRFFDGRLCANGHVSQRLVSRPKCVACADARAVRHRAKKKAIFEADNPEVVRARLLHKSTEARRARRNALLGKWRDENREKLRAYTSKWSAENKNKVKGYSEARKDKKREYDAARYLSNPQISKDKSREWREANGDRALKRVKKWQAKNPEKVRHFKLKNKSKRRGATGSHTLSQIVTLLEGQQFKCAACKKSIKLHRHLDHIMPISRGGSNDIKNLQWLCPPCNLRKNAKHPIDWAQEMGRLL